MRGVLTISSEWTTLRRSKRPPMCYDSRRRRGRRRSQADAALVQQRHPGLELRGQVNRREASRSVTNDEQIVRLIHAGLASSGVAC